jgi:hypothetical protein
VHARVGRAQRCQCYGAVGRRSDRIADDHRRSAHPSDSRCREKDCHIYRPTQQTASHIVHTSRHSQVVASEVASCDTGRGHSRRERFILPGVWQCANTAVVPAVPATVYSLDVSRPGMGGTGGTFVNVQCVLWMSFLSNGQCSGLCGLPLRNVICVCVVSHVRRVSSVNPQSMTIVAWGFGLCREAALCTMQLYPYGN